jgi:hypothetical protein
MKSRREEAAMLWYHGDVMKALVEARQGEIRQKAGSRPETERRNTAPVLPARRRAVVAG